jgi:hypothetical protein
MLVMSTGVGFCTAPTTSAIMNNVPDDKQGVASAVNDATREVGAALGIALAGSLLAARYTEALRPALAALPAAVRDAAGGSLTASLEVARGLGPDGVRVAQLARSSFVEATGYSALVLGAVVAAAAVLIGAWAPGRDGRQLRLVRRIVERRHAESALGWPDAAPARESEHHGLDDPRHRSDGRANRGGRHRRRSGESG